MKKLILILIGVMLVVACNKYDLKVENSQVREESKSFEVKSHPAYEPGVLLVRFKNNNKSRALSSVKGRIVKTIRTKHMERKNVPAIDKIKVENVDQAFESLKSNPDVELVSPNYSRHTMQTSYPNDPVYTSGDLWGMNTINATTAWNAGNLGKRNVYVFLVDEGIKYWHEDLCGQVWTNSFEIPNNNIDDDGNGYVDDIHGWDWFNNDNSIFDNNDFHGTHTAGTIGANGNNGKGVIGVAPQVTIISGKFLESFGYDENAILAYDYAADLKERHGLDIVCSSNSWGGGGYNPFLYEAIQRQADANIALIAAAGNHRVDNDTDPDRNYPSSYDLPNIIAVGASQWDNTPAGFSCWGQTSVDLFAPGTGVVSCYQGELFQINQYVSASGTSMATPHVAGAYALYAATHKGANYSVIKSALLQTVTPNASLTTKCVSGGVLNVSTFTIPTGVEAPGTCSIPEDLDTIAPTIPQNLELVSVSAQQATLRWRSSTDNVGVDHYILTSVGCCIDGTTDTTITIPLQPGTYTWYVQARDRWGNSSPASNTVTGTVPGDEQAPSAPDIYYTYSSSNSISGVFHQGIDNIGIRNNKVYWRKVGEPTYNVTIHQNPATFVFTIPNLLSGTSYEAYVTAVDLTGNESVPSNTVIIQTQGAPEQDTTPPTLNGSPTLSNITASSITVSFINASDNVGVVGYTINWRAVGGAWLSQSTTGNNFTFSNLSQGTTYEFNYNARDAAGNVSNNSATVSGTTLNPDTQPPTIPQGLTSPNTTTSSIDLSWQPSTDNVGVTGYKINWRAVGGAWLEVTTTGTSYTFSNLSSGTSYEFNVQARDAAGNWSGASQTITASTVNPPPPPPTWSVSADLEAAPVQGIHNVQLTWDIQTNGSITEIKLERKKGGSGFSVVGIEIPVNATSCVDNTVSSPGNYTYRLRIRISQSQNYYYSDEVSVKVRK